MASNYVDASSNNGIPNLQAYYDAGHRDLMLKASEGTGYFWPQMQYLARGWHALDPANRVGYYHWLYGNLPAQAQHDWFWSLVAPVWRAGDWLMTDFEDVNPARWVPDAQHAAVVAEFDRLCGQHGEVHDYAPNWYIANMPMCLAYFKLRRVVASDYTNNPAANPYQLQLVAHQFTDRATVPGFSAPVDYNQWLTAAPTPTPTGGFLMALTDAQQIRIAQDADIIRTQMGQVLAALSSIKPQTDKIPALQAKSDQTNWSVVGDASNPGLRAVLAQILTENAALKAQIAAIHAATAGGSVDTQAIAAAVRQSFAASPLTVTVEGTAK